MVLRLPLFLCSFAPAKGPSEGEAYTMTPTADDLKAELLAHAWKLPASGPHLRAGRPERAASAGAELPATFMAAAAEAQPAEQPLLAFPACSSCPPEFWGRPPGCPCLGPPTIHRAGRCPTLQHRHYQKLQRPPEGGCATLPAETHRRHVDDSIVVTDNPAHEL